MSEAPLSAMLWKIEMLEIKEKIYASNQTKIRICRLVEIEEIENPLLVLYVGAGGLLINLLGLFIFHGHTHGHSHDHNDREIEYEELDVENRRK